MRRLPNGADHSWRFGQLIRIATLSAMVLAVFSATTQAQATKKAAAPPTPLDPRPLSRFIPRDNLLILLEFQGLDLQADAWTKTAAYKMLNDTSLGEMLEAMAAQIVDRAMANATTKKMTGADLVEAVKHAMKSGFVFGINPVSDQKAYGTLVIRNGTAKEARATFSRVLGQMMSASKPQVVKKAGRGFVTLPMAAGDDTWAWWAEQNDLVIVLGKGTEDVVATTIDNTTPNATENPIRTELLKTDGGFTPAAILFFDPKAFPAERKAGAAAENFNKIARQGINRIDYRWGFQDNALMSVFRLQAPKPRKGFLALFDQPSMGKKEMPPLPESLTSFKVMSLDSAKVFDAVMGAAPENAKSSVTTSLDSLKTKAKVELRKDILAHIGPKMAVYTMPGTPAKPVDAPPSGAGLSGLFGGFAIPGMGAAGSIPKLTFIAEVDDRAAFERVLDRLMVMVNRELKDRAAEQAKFAKAVETAGSPGQGPGGGSTLTGAVDGGGPAPGARGRRPGGDDSGSGTPAPAPEFKLILGKDKVYQLNVPSSMSSQIPAGFRPTIRLGDKHLVIAFTPDAARAALEVKPGEWTVRADFAPAFDRLSPNFMFLSVDDPRETEPEALASLPATVQRAVNTVALAATSTPGPAAPGETPGVPGGNRGRPGPGPGAMSMPMPGLQPGGPGGGYPGAPGGYPGAAGAGGSGGGGNPEAGSAPALIQFNIDASKLPKAEDLRSKMFPSTFSIVVDDQEISLVSRSSFPNLSAPLSGLGAALALPMAQNAIRAAGVPLGAAAAPAATAPAPGAGGPAGRIGGRRGGGRP